MKSSRPEIFLSRPAVTILTLLIMLLVLNIPCTVFGAIPSSERAALISLYNSTEGDNWSDNSGWKTPPVSEDGFAAPGTENTWYGVTVIGDRVERISLGNNILTGSIPAEIENLPALKELNLYGNGITGMIPPELGNLTGLIYIWLSGNELTGPIPAELGNLQNLTYLQLSENQLSGTLPTELFNLENLLSLDLSFNQVTGTIPPEIGNMTNLTRFMTFSNELTGPIPSELGNLNNLTTLFLSNNQLTGSIPPELGNLTNLTTLYLSNNQLTGSIPPELGNLTNLTILYLSNNRLTGSIPPELGNLTNLTILYLSNNQLTGSIPPELETLPNLTDISFDNNPLIGSWSYFSPQVAEKNKTQTVKVLCKPDVTFTDVKFYEGWTGKEITMRDRGDGVYEAELNVADLISNLHTDDVNRIFAGYVKIYNGSVLEKQYNKFLDVLTEDIPDVTIFKDNDVQITAYLFNTTGTYFTPVEDITGKFYEYYGDDFDFINIIYDEGRHLNRHYISVSNSVQNIGESLFDNSGRYGSGGRLKGVIRFPIPGLFDLAHEVFSHELGHRWVNYIDFEPLYRMSRHWPISTLAYGIMGYEQGYTFNYRINQINNNEWQLHANESPKEYSDLALYLMGLIPYWEVGTHIIFHDQNQPIEDGAVWVGPVTEIDGYDVVSEMGERIPDYNNSIKSFRVATILVTQENLASPEMMRLYDWFSSRAELTEATDTHLGFRKGADNPFYLATRGLATVSVLIDATLSTTENSSTTGNSETEDTPVNGDSKGEVENSGGGNGGGGGCFIETVFFSSKTTGIK